MELTKALELAGELFPTFIPLTVRLKIAGSVRRGAPQVKDLELICIPQSKEIGQETITPGPQLTRTVYNTDAIEGAGRDLVGNDNVSKAGPKYIQFRYKEITVDLFISTHKNCGLNYLLRTGPEEFNVVLLKRANRMGLTSEGSIFKERFGDTKYPAKTEREAFRILQLPWIAPEKRGGSIHRLLESEEDRRKRAQEGFF